MGISPVASPPDYLNTINENQDLRQIRAILKFDSNLLHFGMTLILGSPNRPLNFQGTFRYNWEIVHVAPFKHQSVACATS
jgi:hypothetical protein